MLKKHPILMGTFILTATGFISRFIGFFFRMFLSHTFGEEQVGLYQLIFPIYALCFSLTTAGIETALSRCIAQKLSCGKHTELKQLLYTAIGISVILASFCAVFLQKYALKISIYILGDVRCESMLLAVSYALPFAAVHSCICGYYFGLKETKIPALSQLIEQICRVLSVYLIYLFSINQNGKISILFAVIGLVIGEFSSAFFCVYYWGKHSSFVKHKIYFPAFYKYMKELFSLSIPLTSSRVLLNLLQNVESLSIPIQLQTFGYTNSEALKNYGVLTGMALPCVLFPSAITNSVSTMLLPTVAEMQAVKDYSLLQTLIKKICFSCVMLGSACCIVFVLFSNWMGSFLFHSNLAGKYLQTLAWICPFLYLNSTLLSMINGLGKVNITLTINIISLTIRIIGVLFGIPLIGMNGYLWGLLLSHGFTSFFSVSYLFLHLKKIAH